MSGAVEKPRRHDTKRLLLAAPWVQHAFVVQTARAAALAQLLLPRVIVIWTSVYVPAGWRLDRWDVIARGTAARLVVTHFMSKN